MEKLQIKTVTSEEVITGYAEVLGKSETQMESLKFEIEETPLSGIITDLPLDVPKEYNGNKYFVYSVKDEEGKEIGNLSVNRLFDTYVEKGSFVIVNSEKNKGKVMLRSHRLNDLKTFGKSRAQQIANVIGQKYSAVRETRAIVDNYEAEKMFIKPAVPGKPDQYELDRLWQNTVQSDRLMKINWNGKVQ